MRVPSSTNRRAVGANMTPMIDVVFLLIIFFLVSSHLARQENHLPLDLPIASTHGPVNPDRAPLTISVNPDSQWLVSGARSCLLYTSPSPRDATLSRMPASA